MSEILKSELKKYGENTSVRGISKCFKTNDAFLKVLWLILSFGSTTYMAIKLYALLENYYEYPITTEFGEKSLIANLPFPPSSNLNLFDVTFDPSRSFRGMSLLLNVGPIKNTMISYQSSQSRGVKVSVHSPGILADLKRGFNVAPGTENIVEITQTERRRLDKPHNKLGCTMAMFSYVKYTHDMCNENYLQKFKSIDAGCKSHLLFWSGSELEKSLLKINYIMKQNFPYFQQDKAVHTYETMLGSVGVSTTGRPSRRLRWVYCTCYVTLGEDLFLFNPNDNNTGLLAFVVILLIFMTILKIVNIIFYVQVDVDLK
ncbi:hypothetical protein HELRODRAFT_183438 [Helobdella robusta]|uniref:Uncharacterized protein n=1 Tax=Helobdella robusta TaxID=6412 RepID=T1FJN4_HELRO|nr:hypothetical protein HELRODRAFT_183438 [Helobdella robusta]ESO11197.1 hypothetical protein HELRODRAFT_183438 [Helobdella robusta]